MKLTFDEAIEEHRKMWNWIADETDKRKERVNKIDYFEHNDYRINEYPRNMCFCCEYDRDVRRTQSRGMHPCKYCPISWDGNNTGESDIFCESVGSSYKKWFDVVFPTAEEVAKLAREIANLPARKKTEEDI